MTVLERFQVTRRGRPCSAIHCLRLLFSLLLASFSLALLSGCASKKPAAQMPPAPPPPAPTATIAADPAMVQAGHSLTITWKTENATEVSIQPIGAVEHSGSQTVTPVESITYRLTARGPGGVQESDARVTVTASPDSEAGRGDDSFPSEIASRLDIFFDTDAFSIRPDQLTTIKNDVAFLKEHSEVRVVVEGHCDEPGSTEYNLALGEKRAAEVKFALEAAGVSASRIRTISYGKERPFCEEQSETCWQKNRRAHLVPDMQR